MKMKLTYPVMVIVPSLLVRKEYWALVAKGKATTKSETNQAARSACPSPRVLVYGREQLPTAVAEDEVQSGMLL